MKYDFLIVGAGMFGSTFARVATDAGYDCLVIDKRNHIGGNCYSEKINGINVHKYGPHIFHTNDEYIWKFVNRFSTFNNYTHRVKSRVDNQIYSFPINLFTLNQLWGVSSPKEAKKHLESVKVPHDNPKNLEQWILSQVGWDIYRNFIRGYTMKQWNKHPTELSPSIIKRLPIRLNFDDNYYSDNYQGIPIGGYERLFQNMLYGIHTELGVDYLTDRDRYDKMAHKVVYTGAIDEFFDYEFGEMEWRSLKFVRNELDDYDFQGTSIINYPSERVQYTRIVEYKYFDNPNAKNTVFVYEYPQDYEVGMEKFYPVNTERNQEQFNKYKQIINHKYIFGGRLAEYRYYDMHQIIASAIKKYKTCLNIRQE